MDVKVTRTEADQFYHLTRYYGENYFTEMLQRKSVWFDRSQMRKNLAWLEALGRVSIILNPDMSTREDFMQIYAKLRFCVNSVDRFLVLFNIQLSKLPVVNRLVGVYKGKYGSSFSDNWNDTENELIVWSLMHTKHPDFIPIFPVSVINKFAESIGEQRAAYVADNDKFCSQCGLRAPNQGETCFVCGLINY